MQYTAYQQTIDYLYASQPAFHLVGAAAYKPGLDNTYRLMAHLRNPHEKLRTVHVAGTNPMRWLTRNTWVSTAMAALLNTTL